MKYLRVLFVPERYHFLATMAALLIGMEFWGREFRSNCGGNSRVQGELTEYSAQFKLAEITLLSIYSEEVSFRRVWGGFGGGDLAECTLEEEGKERSVAASADCR